MREVGTEEIADIARGAGILGTGGGGDPYIGRLLAETAIERHGPVTLVTVDEVAPDAVVVPVAMLGAPTVSQEKLPNGTETLAALRALEEATGVEATHLVPIEIGGMNSLIPLALAAETGLPVVDGDAMGRAFPEAQMVLPTLAGIPTSPMAVADDKGNTLVLRTVSNLWAERIARAACVATGCSVYTADTVMTGGQLADGLVAGTITLAGRLGAAARTARAEHTDPATAVAELVGGVRLATGKVVDVHRTTTGGFARGGATIAGTDTELRLSFQNEYLLAERDGEVVATTPDLICVLETDTGEPVTTESMRYGNRVTVLGIPGDPRWRTPAGLEIVGPRYFGYQSDYQPLPDRQV
ncbi:DUF917 domain-containing protein [Actinophytocola oryzae]|uniref:DUF917 domain-containing protein n=1 Tax=Actinophytocola oryzae TaxID=502181 RepID=A0A4R7VHN1_9PSEU|nr:DUF917 domain-containing protein [Actinophytocola oryzae]TDV48863.1 hypothetical protein CLV71_108223 [Actinophytocola oryzae]